MKADRRIAARDITVTTRSERPLSELCADLFMFILHLRVTKELEDPDRVRQQCRDMFSLLDRQARHAGIDFAQVEQSKFALAAFVDEAITGVAFDQKDAWMSNPLQLEMFNRHDAGEEFFVRLHNLRQHPVPNVHPLEVYYMCLVLGFKGKFQYQDREGLRALIEDTRVDLFRAREIRSTVALSPHGTPQEGILHVVSKEIPVWVTVTAAASVGVLFYIVMSLLINAEAANAVTAILGTR